MNVMDILKFIKYKKYYLNHTLHTVILKKIILTYKNSFLLKNRYYRFRYLSKKTIPNLFDIFLVYYKKDQSELTFLKNVIFLKNLILHNFFSNKLFNLVITFKFTKFNFFVTPSSDSYPMWRLFIKKNDYYIDKIKSPLHKSSTRLITTFSAGQVCSSRKGRVRFEHFNIGTYFTILILSIFWSSLNKWTSKLFKFNIKIKGNTRWIRHVIWSVRNAFKKLYNEHKWYIKKNKKLFMSKSNLVDIEKYNSSIQRLKQIVVCPIFFNSLQITKQLPHNGCRLKKVHLRCRDIKRINSRRMNR